MCFLKWWIIFDTVPNKTRYNLLSICLAVPSCKKYTFKLCKKKCFVFICKIELGAKFRWLWVVFHLHECTEDIRKPRVAEDSSWCGHVPHEAGLVPGSCPLDALRSPNYGDNPKPAPRDFPNAPEGWCCPSKDHCFGGDKALSYTLTGFCLPVEGGRADGKTEVQRENVTPSSWGVSNREGTLNRWNLGLDGAGGWIESP